MHLLALHSELPKSIKDNADAVLFVDDTSIIVKSPNPIIFENTINKVFLDINGWFTVNLLSLNVDKAQFMQFVTKINSLLDLNIIHGDKKIVMKSIFFWDMKPCSALSGTRRSSETSGTTQHSTPCHLLARCFAELFYDPEDGGDMFL
jgi:hypothetical protein